MAESRKNRASALINLSGLAIGLSAFLLIVYFVRYELSYDSFLPNAGRIYRVTVRQEENNQTGMHSARTYAAVSPVLKSEIPEVESAVRILSEECLLHYKPAHTKFNNQKTYWADADFYKLFGLSFVEREISICFRNPIMLSCLCPQQDVFLVTIGVGTKHLLVKPSG